MKTKLVIVTYLVLSLNACSSDPANTLSDSLSPNENEIIEGTEQITIIGDFFPLDIGNKWNYNVVNKDNITSNATNTIDVLSVENKTNNSYILNANNGGVVNGTINNLLTTGKLTTTSTELIANGEFASPINGVPLSIPFTNAKFYDTEANLNATIYTLSNEIKQTIQDVPFTISYNLKATQLDNKKTFLFNGINYANVTSAKITLNLKVEATVTVLGFSQVFTVLDPKDVVTITSYYADGIGLINSISETSYSITTTSTSLLSQAGIDIPTTVSFTNTQSIDTYTVN